MADVEQKYKAILTPFGIQAMLDALSAGDRVKISYMGIGDGDGSVYAPVEGQTDLKNEWHELSLNGLFIDPKNPAWLIAEGVIPEGIGGHYVREISLKDEQKRTVTVASVPESYKPNLDEGASKAMVIRSTVEVSNTEVFELKIDTSLALVTRDEFIRHTSATQAALDGKAATAHSHVNADIMNLDAEKITTGTLADARIPNLNASKITAGEFASARIANNAVTTAKIQNSAVTAAKIASGVIPTLATNTVAGTVRLADSFSNTVERESVPQVKAFIDIRGYLDIRSDNGDKPWRLAVAERARALFGNEAFFSMSNDARVDMHGDARIDMLGGEIRIEEYGKLALYGKARFEAYGHGGWCGLNGNHSNIDGLPYCNGNNVPFNLALDGNSRIYTITGSVSLRQPVAAENRGKMRVGDIFYFRPASHNNTVSYAVRGTVGGQLSSNLGETISLMFDGFEENSFIPYFNRLI